MPNLKIFVIPLNVAKAAMILIKNSTPLTFTRKSFAKFRLALHQSGSSEL